MSEDLAELIPWEFFFGFCDARTPKYCLLILPLPTHDRNLSCSFDIFPLFSTIFWAFWRVHAWQDKDFSKTMD
jgi:hypothetical protein